MYPHAKKKIRSHVKKSCSPCQKPVPFGKFSKVWGKWPLFGQFLGKSENFMIMVSRQGVQRTITAKTGRANKVDDKRNCAKSVSFN